MTLAPEINMLTQLQKFPEMEVLVAIYTADEFFYEADTFIDACSTTMKHMLITLINDNMSFERPQFPALDLGSVRTSPHVEYLHLHVLELTARDLVYMAHRFTGLKRLFIEGEALEDEEAVDRMLADGLFSAQEYIDAFEWMISIKSFEVIDLPLAGNVRELLAFWAKRPQLKAMTIEESSDDPSGAATFSIMNTEGEVSGNESNFKYKEKGAWEMYLNIYYDDPTVFFEETLETFKGSTVEHIFLVSNSEIEGGSKTIGESFNYVMEHFTAIKEIGVAGARLASFHATTVHKTLAKLNFLCCSITSKALLQLSPHVCYIENLQFSIVTLLNDRTGYDDIFLIDMPQTSIGEVTVWHNNKMGFLVKVCKYGSFDTAQDTIQQQYFMMNKDGKFELKEDFYNETLSNEEIYSTYNIVVICCADLKTLSVRSDKLDYSIDVVNY